MSENLTASRADNPELFTLGEKRVRTNFNVSGNDTVTQIKGKTAELINLVDCLPFDPAVANTPESSRNHEKRRLIALAMTAYEEAAMWAVKAATA